MAGLAHEFQELEANTTWQEFSVKYEDLPPYLVLVCVIGIVTNAALLYILTKVNLKNTQNALILSLALSNMLFVLLYIPFDIAVIASKSYPFSETLCKATEFINSICFFVLPFTLIALSARCILDKTEDGRTHKSIIVAIVAIWSVAVVLALPSLLMASITEREDHLMYCPVYGRGFTELEIVVQLFIIVTVPVAAVGCYFCDRRNRDRSGNARSHEQRDIVRLVLLLTALYAVCHIPSAILDVWTLFSWFNYDSFWHGVSVTGTFLYFGYPIASAVALFCASGSYRQLLKQHMLFWCKSGNQEHVVNHERGSQPLVHSTRPPPA